MGWGWTQSFATGDKAAQWMMMQGWLKRPLLVISMAGGSYTQSLRADVLERIGNVVSRGVVRAASKTDTVIVDSGTAIGASAPVPTPLSRLVGLKGKGWRRAGVSQLVGKSVMERRSDLRAGSATGSIQLVGVCLYDKVTNAEGKIFYPGSAYKPTSTDVCIDDNHSIIVAAEGSRWGDELPFRFSLEYALSQSIPSVLVVVNGDFETKRFILRAIRQNSFVVIVKGTGRLADFISILWEIRWPGRSPNRMSQCSPRAVDGAGARGGAQGRDASGRGRAGTHDAGMTMSVVDAVTAAATRDEANVEDLAPCPNGSDCPRKDDREHCELCVRARGQGQRRC